MKIHRLFITIATILMHVNANGNIIEVKNGIIKVNGDGCLVTVNGEEAHIIDGAVPGLNFGVVNYDCKNGVGFLISKLECYDCGLFCAGNELIDGCQNMALPITLGMLIGSAISVITIICCRRFIASIVMCIIEKWYEWKQIRFDNACKKQVDKININTNSDHPCNFRYRYHLSPRGKERVDKNRQRLLGSAILLAGVSLLSVAEAHDKTLFMHSTGRICENNKCTDSDMISMNLMTGNTLLLEDDQGKKVELSVVDTYYRYRYSYMYDTSDYDIEMESEYHCKAMGGKCWNGNCKENSKYEGFKDIPGQLARFGCVVDTLGCDTWCFNQISCTWYKAVIKPVGNKHKLYEYQSRIWEVVLSITKDGYSTKHVINSNNPMLNIDNIGKENGSYPMLINAFLTEDEKPSDHLLEINGNVYSVDASRVNFPMLDRIGDLQIDTNGNMTFPMDRLDCGSRSCQAYCKMVDSPIKRFKHWMNRHLATEYRSVVRGKIIEVKDQVQCVLNFMLQLNGFKQLDYSAASCSFEVISVFACEACKEKPMVILKPTTLTRKGLLEIVSNCSLETNLLPCTGNPIHLKMQEMPKYCTIHVLRTNQTIDVTFDYVYLGSVESMQSHLTFSTIDEFTSLVSSENFLTSLISSATSILGLGILFSAIMRLIYIYEVNKTVQSVRM